MKKIFYWFFAALLICGGTSVIASCNEDDVEDIVESLNLIGDWKVSNVDVSPKLAEGVEPEIKVGDAFTFMSDLTFRFSNGAKGKWRLSGKQIFLTPEGGSEVMWASVKSYDKKSMVIYRDNGDYTITVTAAKQGF